MVFSALPDDKVCGLTGAEPFAAEGTCRFSGRSRSPHSFNLHGYSSHLLAFSPPRVESLALKLHGQVLLTVANLLLPALAERGDRPRLI